MQDIQFICVNCQTSFAMETVIVPDYCKCGGLLIINKINPVFHDDWIDTEDHSMWKFYKVLSVQVNQKEWEKLTLGEGNTYLDKLDADNTNIYLKFESTLPSQTYIDRCSALLVTKLKEQHIQKIILENTDVRSFSIAKYARQAKIPCELFINRTSNELINLFKSEGVEVINTLHHENSSLNHQSFRVPAIHPFMIEGAKTYAYEIWEQLGHQEPDILTFPMDSSILIIGAYYAFKDLFDQHLIKKMPKFIIAHTQTSTLQSKISIPKNQEEEIDKIIKETGGHLQRISKAEVVQAGKALVMRGFQADEQSTACYAGCMRYYRDFSIKDEVMVIPLSNCSAFESLMKGGE